MCALPPKTAFTTGHDGIYLKELLLEKGDLILFNKRRRFERRPVWVFDARSIAAECAAREAGLNA